MRLIDDGLRDWHVHPLSLPELTDSSSPSLVPACARLPPCILSLSIPLAAVNEASVALGVRGRRGLSAPITGSVIRRKRENFYLTKDYIYTYVRTHIHTYIHTYTHTYIHTYI